MLDHWRLRQYLVLRCSSITDDIFIVIFEYYSAYYRLGNVYCLHCYRLYTEYPLDGSHTTGCFYLHCCRSHKVKRLIFAFILEILLMGFNYRTPAIRFTGLYRYIKLLVTSAYYDWPFFVWNLYLHFYEDIH